MTHDGLDGVTDHFFVAVTQAAAGEAAEVDVIAGGRVQTFPMMKANPKKPIRFAAGEPGRRSSVWRLWANKTKGDVYLATRQSASIFKVSLHESGDWRLQWVGQDHRDVVHFPGPGQEPEGRILHRWQRPGAGATGWTDALSLWVPAEDVVDYPNDAESGGDVQWVPAAPPGWGTCYRIYLVEPGRGGVDLTAALTAPHGTLGLVNGFQLDTGEVVLLFAATEKLAPEVQAGIGRIMADHMTDQLPPDFDLEPATGPRTAVWTSSPSGYLEVWDLSLLRGLR